MASIVYGLKETGEALFERSPWIVGAHFSVMGIGYLVGGTPAATLASKIATMCSLLICGIEHPPHTPKRQDPLGRWVGNFLPLAVAGLSLYMDGGVARPA